jgi:DNA-binding MurR/RpiR family transcriptional regulator
MTAGFRKKTPEIISEDDIKKSLMNKYAEMFIDKLTSEDLDEFQFFLKKQYYKESGWNYEYKLKFESKLRQYFHEEVMKREIASIETLLGLLSRKDLKNKP